MYIILFLIAIILDQLTKYLAIIYLKGKPQIILINNWLHLNYVENSGAAFGIFQNGTIIFILLTILIIFGVIFYLLKYGNNIGSYFKFFLVIILAGAIGNLIDRIRLGYVVDFIFTPLGGLYDFPIFNLADIYVVVGAIALMVYIYFFEGKNAK